MCIDLLKKINKHTLRHTWTEFNGLLSMHETISILPLDFLFTPHLDGKNDSLDTAFHSSNIYIDTLLFWLWILTQAFIISKKKQQ